jgi:GT2 family glycosyltransferase
MYWFLWSRNVTRRGISCLQRSRSTTTATYQWQPIAWEDGTSRRRIEIDAAGSAGMLVRRHVFDNIGEPYFASTNGAYLNEDVAFCAKVKGPGYRIFATADVTMGHIGIFATLRRYRKTDVD